MLGPRSAASWRRGKMNRVSLEKKALLIAILYLLSYTAFCAEYITDQIIGIYKDSLLIKQIVQEVDASNNVSIEVYFIEKRMSDGKLVWQKRVEEIQYIDGVRKNIFADYKNAFIERPYFLSGYEYLNSSIFDYYKDDKLMVNISEELWFPYDISEKIRSTYPNGTVIRLINSYYYGEKYIFVVLIRIGEMIDTIYEKAIIVDEFEIMEM
jgi:hypothetical protein